MIYLAYGSNLHIEQMQRRCPTAEVLGTSEEDLLHLGRIQMPVRPGGIKSKGARLLLLRERTIFHSIKFKASATLTESMPKLQKTAAISQTGSNDTRFDPVPVFSWL